jgi:hypothetical protein
MWLEEKDKVGRRRYGWKKKKWLEEEDMVGRRRYGWKKKIRLEEEEEDKVGRRRRR